jgi:hypothetical protein
MPGWPMPRGRWHGWGRHWRPTKTRGCAVSKSEGVAMADARKTRKSDGPAAPRVAIIGGGISGLTAALRLSQRGFAVSLFEAKPELGGNMSSTDVGGIEHDVYPHMFCDWYANFWEIFETDLGFLRDHHFEPQDGVKILPAGATEFFDLKNPSTVATVWEDLRLGLVSVPEMILLMFSMLDLASYPFQRNVDDDLDKVDVNGFLYSRGYSTETVAKLHNYILTLVWSVNSDMTAAKSYQDFLRHFSSFPNEQPLAWLLKGSLEMKIIRPLADKLRVQGCSIEAATPVTSIDLIDGKPVLTIAPTRAAARTESFDYCIIATPVGAMIDLVMGRAGEDNGRKVIRQVPRLAQMQHFRDAAIPVVDIYFKGKLANVPQGQIGLQGTRYMLSVVDISQLWQTSATMRDRTVLVLAASDGFAIPTRAPDVAGFAMIEQLHQWLPIFNPGKFWGDPDSDIDWTFSHFRSNDSNRLFINDVGSWAFRPQAADPEALPNVFLAGDYCQSGVDMATIEAAVQTGLLAAQALQAQDAKASGQMRGDPITLAEDKAFGSATLLAAKLALLPAAYGASAWAAWDEAKAGRPQGFTERSGSENYPLLLPLGFALDWAKTAYSLALEVAPAVREMKADDVIGLGARTGRAGLMAVADVLDSVAARQPGRGEAAEPSELATAFSNFVGAAVRAAEKAVTSRSPRPDPQGPYKRRWRVKP